MISIDDDSYKEKRKKKERKWQWAHSIKGVSFSLERDIEKERDRYRERKIDDSKGQPLTVLAHVRVVIYIFHLLSFSFLFHHSFFIFSTFSPPFQLPFVVELLVSREVKHDDAPLSFHAFLAKRIVDGAFYTHEGHRDVADKFEGHSRWSYQMQSSMHLFFTNKKLSFLLLVWSEEQKA